jgi:hypothetical protein
LLRGTRDLRIVVQAIPAPFSCAHESAIPAGFPPFFSSGGQIPKIPPLVRSIFCS